MRPIYPLFWQLLLTTLLLAACQRSLDEQGLMANARQYQARGELKSAIIELKNALQKHPNNGVARLLLAGVYLDSGNLPSAEKEFRRAIAAGTPAATALPGLGKSLLAQGLFDQVLAELPPNPAFAATEVLRAEALQGLGKFNQAQAQLEDLLPRFPTHPAVLLALSRQLIAQGKFGDARTLIEKSLAANPQDIDSERLLADVLRLQGMNHQAMQIYAQVLVQRPGHLATLLDLASLHIQAGRYPDAKASLAAARKILPNSVQLIYTQALLDFRQRHLKAAQEQLQLLLRAAPEHMPSVLLMGTVQSALRSWAQAEAYLRKFLEAYPRHVYASKILATVLLKSGNTTEAIHILQPLLAAQGQDADLLALAGEAYLALGHYAEAEKLFQQASTVAPDTALLHAALGVSQLQQGDSARAIAALEKASRFDAPSAPSGVLLVLSQLRSKAYPQALSSVNQMLARQGKQPLLLNLRGGVLLVSGEHQAARASFMQALAIDPAYFPAIDNLTQLDQIEQRPDAARQRLEAALARTPQSPDLMNALARLALAGGDRAAAQGWLERATRAQPDALPPAMNLLAFYLQNRDSQQALRLARQLQPNHPDDPGLLSMLAEAQSQAGQPRAALETLQKLVALQPDSAEAQYRLANVQIALKNTDAVRSALQKSLSLRPDYPQAQVMLIQTLLQDGGYQEALRIARQVQQLHAESPLGLKLEGDILMARQQASAAAAVYQRAFDLQPAASQLMPLYRAQLLSGHQPAATRLAEQWLSTHPDDTQVRLYHGNSLLERKDYARAASLFEEVLKKRPADVLALNNLAWARWQLGDQGALALAENAFKLAPNNPAVQDTLAWILAERGQLARALPLLKSASMQAGATDEVRLHYAQALVRAGDKSAARTQLQSLLANKQSPRQREVQALLGQL